ncbi:MAG: hypothetical protein AAGE89_08455 [Pseudomonadota bacterium]
MMISKNARSLAMALVAAGGIFAAYDFVAPSVAEAGRWERCNHEGGHCKPNRYSTMIRYGVAGKWRIKHTRASKWCSNNEFGDPAPGRRKVCDVYYPDWEKCNHEGGVCRVGKGTQVRYGTNPHRPGKFIQKAAPSDNGITCSNHAFGGDPVRGKRKNCFVLR